MENNVNNSEQMAIPIFKILYRNLLLIVLITILCAFLSLGYSVLRVKPTYTASRSVILRTTMSREEGGNASNLLSNQATLAKLYLPNIAKLIKSPDVVAEVNEAYDNDNEKINRSAIGVKYGEQSLIFTISYTDKTAELAEEKLNAVIDTFAISDQFQDCVQAEDAQLIHTQKECYVIKSTTHVKYALIGGVVGVIISIVVATLTYMLDNTIKSKNEIEELTGVYLLSYIDKEKPIKA